MKKKICYPFVGDSVGGSHKSTLQLIINLDKEKYEPLIVLHTTGMLANHFENLGLKYHVLNLPVLAGSRPSIAHILLSLLRITPSLIRFIIKNKIHIVHGNDQRVNFSWSLATRISNRKFIWHQRTLLSSSVLWKVIRFAANQVICISEAVFNKLPRNSQLKATIVTNPFDQSLYLNCGNERDIIQKKYKIKKEVTMIGFVGRLVEQKRPETFLYVASEILQSKSNDCVFLLIGQGKDEYVAKLKALADKLGIKKNVFFLGFCDPVEPYIKALDIICATEIGDGFGRTLVESMYLNTLVIATKSGGHAEIIENNHTGYLVPEDDVDAFTSRIHRLINNENISNRLKASAYEHVNVEYTVEKHVKSMSNIYEKV